MPDTEARIGHGTVFEFADAETPTEFDYIAEIFNLSAPNEETEDVEATHTQSPGGVREFVGGLTDGGEASFEMNYVPGSASDLAILAARGKRKWNRFTFPNGVSIMFFGTRQTYERNVPTDDRMTASVSIKVSGEPVQTPIAAPRNIAAPAVAGDPEIGAPLTLDPGIWAGALEVLVQWQKDDAGNETFADIPGATSLAYVPVAADEGDHIRAKVTGKNAEFSTDAFSDDVGPVSVPNAE